MINRVHELLRDTNRDHSYIEAQIVGNNLPALMAIENLILSNEHRRDSILEEIERHRSFKAKRGAINAEFNQIKTSELGDDKSQKG